jgi:hypothetical protein
MKERTDGFAQKAVLPVLFSFELLLHFLLVDMVDLGYTIQCRLVRP